MYSWRSGRMGLGRAAFARLDRGRDERGWVLLPYHPLADFSWVDSDQGPLVAVVGPDLPAPIARLGPEAVGR